MIVKTETRDILDPAAFGALRANPTKAFVDAQIAVITFNKRFADSSVKLVNGKFVKTLYFKTAADYQGFQDAAAEVASALAVIESGLSGVLSPATEVVETI